MHDVNMDSAPGLNERLVRFYFNRVYNPLYDVTTARFSVYQHLQEACVGKFKFEDGDSILCVGIGTGNEIPYLLGKNSKLNIVGIDMSTEALKKASHRAKGLGKEIQLFKMDARDLRFQDESFDKVLCLHVMDFVDDYQLATQEIMRVLKKRGQYVVTFPSQEEGIGLGLSIFNDNLHRNIRARRYSRALREIIMQITVSLVYAPLLFRNKRRSFSRQDLEKTFASINLAQLQIEEDNVYKDFIVYGNK